VSESDAHAKPIVRTRQGQLRGSASDGVFTFKGIPYAAPPFGANRLLPPQPVDPWSGVRDALAFGPKSLQPAYPPLVESLIPPEATAGGEDCLTLNVWSPALGSARLPVLVWIAGGMFAYHATGASSWYDGSRFARDGTVCVTINYRVGPDGFLYLGEDNANRGLLDQIAALQWVQENIAAFGGDPHNVTVFGESAGALSIGTLLAVPRAEGLFRRAIAQSGAAHHVSSAATAQRIAQRFAERLGVAATREALAGVPLERLMAGQVALEQDLGADPDPERWGPEVVTTFLPWQPAIDGTVIPARPIDRIAAGASAGIELIVGTNVDEHRLFLVPGGAIDQITPEVLSRLALAYGLSTDALSAYRAMYPAGSVGDVWAAILTDWYWRIPALQLADAHATNGGVTFIYEFAWVTPQFDGRLGACHAIEIPFVFDTLGQSTEPLLGSDPPQQLADAMHGAWVRFATSGDPGWSQYDLSRRATMRFNIDSAVVDDPRAAERALWEGVR
jgi:carboxylesterase type B